MTYGGKWNNLSYQAGLRGEYWRVDTRSLDFDQEFNGKPSETFEKDYFKLFQVPLSPMPSLKTMKYK